MTGMKKDDSIVKNSAVASFVIYGQANTIFCDTVDFCNDTGLPVTSIEFRAQREEAESERERGGHLSRGDLRNGSCAHDGMRVSLRASGYSCGAAVLGTCSMGHDPLYARTKEGVNGLSREKECPGA